MTFTFSRGREGRVGLDCVCVFAVLLSFTNLAALRITQQGSVVAKQPVRIFVRCTC
jgi:hypothetical protein